MSECMRTIHYHSDSNFVHNVLHSYYIAIALFYAMYLETQTILYAFINSPFVICCSKWCEWACMLLKENELLEIWFHIANHCNLFSWYSDWSKHFRPVKLLAKWDSASNQSLYEIKLKIDSLQVRDVQTLWLNFH